MLEQLRKWPSVRVLADVGDCILFTSAAWISVFCRMDGPVLLLEVLLYAGQFLGQALEIFACEVDKPSMSDMSC